MRPPLTLSTGLVENPRLFSSSCPLTGGHSPGFRICDLLFPQYQRSHTFSQHQVWHLCMEPQNPFQLLRQDPILFSQNIHWKFSRWMLRFMTFTLLSKLTQATLQSLYRNHRHCLKRVWALSVNLALLTLTRVSHLYIPSLEWRRSDFCKWKTLGRLPVTLQTLNK